MYNIIFTQRKSIKNFNRSLTILGGGGGGNGGNGGSGGSRTGDNGSGGSGEVKVWGNSYLLALTFYLLALTFYLPLNS